MTGKGETMERIRHLGQAPVGGLIVKYSVPAIAGMVVYGLNRIVGNAFVGKFLGSEALAGFTVANSIVMIQLSFIMLVGSGSSALISMLLGKKDGASATRALGTALAVGLIVAAALAIPFGLFAKPILAAFGGRGEALEYGAAFIRVYLAGSAFAFWNTTLNSAIRAEGMPGKALLTNIVSFVANTALTVLFVAVIPLGIAGVALANVISQFAVTAWLGAHFLGKKTALPVSRESLAIDRNLGARMLAIGLAPFCMQFLGACMSLVTNNLIQAIAGNFGLAVSGSVFSVYFLLIMPLQGTSTGIQPIIGYNFGAGFRERVKKTVNASLAFTFAICVAEAALAYTFRLSLGGLFTNGDASLAAACARGLSLILLAFPVMCVQFVGSSYFLATGNAKSALAVNLFRSLAVLAPLFLLSARFGMDGLFVAYPVTDFAVTILCAFLLVSGMRRKEKPAVAPSRETSPAEPVADAAQTETAQAETARA